MKAKRPKKKYYEMALRGELRREAGAVLSEADFKAGADSYEWNMKEAGRIAEEMQRRLRNKLEQFLMRVGSVFSTYGSYKGSLRKADGGVRVGTQAGAIRAYAGVMLGGSGPYTEAIEVMARQGVFWDQAFKGYSRATSNKFKEVVQRAYEGPNHLTLRDMKLKDGTVISGIRDEMVRTSGSLNYKLYNISRTEVSSVSNAALEYGYRSIDPEGEGKYEWDIVEDARTSDVCEAIHAQVKREGKGRGVTLDRLAQIVEGQSRRHMGPNWRIRRWVPHPQCRSAPEMVR